MSHATQDNLVMLKMGIEEKVALIERSGIESRILAASGNLVIGQDGNSTLAEILPTFKDEYYKFLDILRENSLVFYGARPIDYARKRRTVITWDLLPKKIRYSLFFVDPIETQNLLLDNAKISRIDVGLQAAREFIADYICMLFMLSADRVSFAFDRPTVGTGFEFYVAIAAKLGIVYQGWNAEIAVAANQNDPLIALLKKDSKLNNLIRVYKKDKFDRIIWDFAVGEDEKPENQIDSREGRTILDDIVKDLRRIALTEGKFYQKGDLRYYDISGSGTPLNPQVEPYMLFLYARDVLEGCIIDVGDDISAFQLPDKNSRKNFRLIIPWSSRQREKYINITLANAGVLGNLLGSVYSYEHVPDLLKRMIIAYAKRNFQREQFQDKTSDSPAIYARRFVPDKNIYSPAYDLMDIVQNQV
ncbi:hypothetical protein JXB41_02905 [Candidatus Woesearchaeota archaeon]|nr:hypothetical protein [Candidatus Woesearchaeota archaeon]